MEKQIKVFITTSVLLCVMFVSLPATGSAQKLVAVWTYYDFPPFLIGERQGLVHDFIGLMNHHAQGRYRFELGVYPRKRLDMKLESGEQGVVLFVHWSYMGDGERTKYFWGPVIMPDRNEIVSRADRKVVFDGTAASLKGLRFGGVLGRRYPLLKDAMERGEIYRENSHGEEQNIRKLLAGRIDATTIPKPVLHHFVKTMGLEGRLYVSPTPITVYTRHLLVTKGLRAEHEFLSRFVRDISDNAEWRRIMKKYGY